MDDVSRHVSTSCHTTASPTSCGTHCGAIATLADNWLLLQCHRGYGVRSCPFVVAFVHIKENTSMSRICS